MKDLESLPGQRSSDAQDALPASSADPVADLARRLREHRQIMWNGDVKPGVPKCQLVPLDLLNEAIEALEATSLLLAATRAGLATLEGLGVNAGGRVNLLQLAIAKAEGRS
jgi:hypothetical protein